MFTFCWVTWAGRVRRSLKRAVLAMRVPHHGMPGSIQSMKRGVAYLTLQFTASAANRLIPPVSQCEIGSA